MLTGKRVRLRAVERDDIPRFVAWLNDPEVIENLLINNPLSTVQEERWFEHMLTRPLDEQPLAIDVRSAEGWTHIGNCAFNEIDRTHSHGEVGIFIGDKKSWNQGYGTEAMRLLVKHGFNDLNLHRIYLMVYETNPRAMRSYEKAGFVKDGCLRDDVYKNGRYINAYVMSILRPEWKDEDI